MWADILLSITMSVSEAIGCSYIEKKKKGKMLKELPELLVSILKNLQTHLWIAMIFIYWLKVRNLLKLCAIFL